MILSSGQYRSSVLIIRRLLDWTYLLTIKKYKRIYLSLFTHSNGCNNWFRNEVIYIIHIYNVPCLYFFYHFPKMLGIQNYYFYLSKKLCNFLLY